jgi:hypothetical protein
MTKLQTAALISAQTALLNCRVTGMQAENQAMSSQGNGIPYRGDSFTAVSDEFEPILGLEAITKLFAEASDADVKDTIKKS